MIPLSPFAPEPARGRQIWGLAAPLLALLFVAAPLVPAMLLLKHLGLLDATDNPAGMAGLATFLLLPFALIGLLVLAWIGFVEKRPPATIGLTRPGGPRRYLGGLAIGCAMTAAIVAAIWAAGGADAGGFAPAFATPAALLNIAILLACFAVQASVEEILFRGWLFSAVARKLNVPIAVVLTASVFALLHYGPGQPLLFTFNIVLFSIFACLWALRAGSIWGVMGWHTGWNWLLATGFELRVTGLDAHQPALLVRMVADGPFWLTGGGEGPEGSLFCTLAFVAGILLLASRAAPRRRVVSMPAQPAGQ